MKLAVDQFILHISNSIFGFIVNSVSVYTINISYLLELLMDIRYLFLISSSHLLVLVDRYEVIRNNLLFTCQGSEVISYCFV